MHKEKYNILNGWCNGAVRRPSPNADERPAGEEIDLLVIHAISLPPDQFTGGHVIDFFQNKLAIDEHEYFREIAGLRVSSHFFIERDGKLTQCVSTEQRAWHCGESQYCGRTSCNDFSIGIELEGCDTIEFEDAQYDALAGLTAALRQAYPAITPERITGHCHIAPGRKTDPGPCFDWHRYRRTV
ncbi:MAG: 1,6-anhydro-N-acetylmuramyl-L-alanine amidase AmpD [Gammaproteobacteria bacterium]